MNHWRAVWWAAAQHKTYSGAMFWTLSPQHLIEWFLKMTRCWCGFLKSHMESFKRYITEDDKNASSDRNHNRYLTFLSRTKTTFFQRLYFKEKTSFLILSEFFVSCTYLYTAVRLLKAFFTVKLVPKIYESSRFVFVHWYYF